ncbi:Na+/H+ antiporter [Ameyamaea chiangmaiensis NBRC 103196]|uniref:Na+/H+ antiporter n=1 Tax=Ameyamaea chiangmaiensis TaxID=442969 RepID=A0A850PB70_9PROT|nr:Na+/H+ antiporter [Ameyamaea chiangmaiensis]MBS4073832.1 Na+/H+ antiporter [Ameyamaea chiangmaiensis]NVN39172.1 Na+/H+ antiporter [Ameyamaea chiangmaiensis]GBQ68264.1 Na+/H+ antiporter [Ameyamaea chiangmaiensis NBRC 103196]
MALLNQTLCLLLLCAVAGLLGRIRRLPVPLPLIQILAGIVAALLGFHVALDPALFMVLFLPPLLFSDAFRMPLREFSQLKVSIFSLAFGVVLISTVLCGYAVHWILPALSLPICFTLAAALSPTDTIAVSSLLSGRKLPARLIHILSGEALFNDASGLVCFRVASVAAMTGVFSYRQALWAFALLSLGGVAIGVAMALAAAWAERMIVRLGLDEAPLQITTMTLLPFGIYIAADSLHCSGILATVAGCMTLKLSGVLHEAPTVTRLQGGVIWDLIGYLFNALIFVLLGLQMPALLSQGLDLAHHSGATGLALAGLVCAVFAIMLVVRFAGIWLTVLERVIGERLRGRRAIVPSLGASLLLTVAGVRGAVTLAAVLSLPMAGDAGDAFPARGLLIVVAAGVIVVSLLVASVTLPLLARMIPSPADDPIQREEERARAALLRTALRVLRKEQAGIVPAAGGKADELRLEIVARLMQLYQNRLDQTGEDAAAAPSIRVTALRRERLELALRLTLLRAQRHELKVLHAAQYINDESEWAMQQELDVEESLLRRRSRRLPHEVPASAGAEAPPVTGPVTMPVTDGMIG